MPYVMVPVPEEHVEDVMQFVLRAMARASIEPWDAESMKEFFLEIDEPSRTLLSVLARAAVTGKELTERDVGDLIELNTREVVGMVRQLNDMAQEASHPTLVVNRRVPELLPNGRTREKRIMAVLDEVVAFVQEAERAELLADTSDPDQA